MTRAEKLKAVWRHTHRDYRGIGDDGEKRVLIWRNGTSSVPLDCLTDEEIESHLPKALREVAP